MRVLLTGIAAVSLAGAAFGQTATVMGQVLLREADQPLPYTTVSILTNGTQFLTAETGRFTVANLLPGEVRLRFKRIGFTPFDT